MPETVISPERLAAFNERVRRFNGFTIRKFTTDRIVGAGGRDASVVYHQIAPRFSHEAFREQTLLSLTQAEADAVVDGFLGRTDEEIRRIASQYT
jgi:hypothetical protein